MLLAMTTLFLNRTVSDLETLIFFSLTWRVTQRYYFRVTWFSFGQTIRRTFSYRLLSGRWWYILSILSPQRMVRWVRPWSQVQIHRFGARSKWNPILRYFLDPKHYALPYLLVLDVYLIFGTQNATINIRISRVFYWGLVSLSEVQTVTTVLLLSKIVNKGEWLILVIRLWTSLNSWTGCAGVWRVD